VTIILGILLGVLFFCILWLLLICPNDAAPALSAPFLGRAIAHRGLHDLTEQTPENSPAAFREAVEKGYGIELDIALSRDGQVVVFHDSTLSRICGLEGKIEDFDYADLQKLSLCGTEERIPLFSDVLALVGGKVPLIVEFKTTARRKELAEKGLALLGAYSGAYCVESFDPRLLREIRRLRPDIFRGQLSCRDLKTGSRLLDFLGANLLINILSRPHFIAYRHEDRKNLSYRAATRLLHAVPVAWTVRTKEEYYRLFDEGIDIQIFENFLPPVLLVAEETDEEEHHDEPKESK